MGKPEFDVISFFSDKGLQRQDFWKKKCAIEVLRTIITGELSSIEVGKDFLYLKLLDGRMFHWKMASEQDNNFTVLTHLGHYERRISELIPKCISRDSIIIDIGANKGWFTVLFGKIVETGSVFAFEPEKNAFDELIRNIDLNNLKNIVPLNLAVSNYTGTGKMEVPFNHSSLAYLTNKRGSNSDDTSVITLDDFIEKYQLLKVDLIKIDAEGSEYDILLGAKRLLSTKYAPVLIIEAFDKCLSRYNTNVNKIIDYLLSLNYHIIDIESGEEYNEGNRKNEYDTDLLCFKKKNKQQYCMEDNSRSSYLN